MSAGFHDRWLRVPGHRREIENLNGKVCPDRIRDETATHLERLKELSERTFGEFAELLLEKVFRDVVPICRFRRRSDPNAS